jgi:hypothetical protein
MLYAGREISEARGQTWSSAKQLEQSSAVECVLPVVQLLVSTLQLFLD